MQQAEYYGLTGRHRHGHSGSRDKSATSDNGLVNRQLQLTEIGATSDELGFPAPGGQKQ